MITVHGAALAEGKMQHFLSHIFSAERKWLTPDESQYIQSYTDFKFDLHVPRDSPDMIPSNCFERRAWPGSREWRDRALNCWALNANCSSTVKGINFNFKFDVHAASDSLDMASYKISEKGRGQSRHP